MLKINVVTSNSTKLKAARSAYSLFYKSFRLKMIPYQNSISQPSGLKQIIRLARKRAILGYRHCDHSVGIESGIFKLKYLAQPLVVSFCCIYDGMKFHYGAGPLFSLPKFGLLKKDELSKALSKKFKLNEHDVKRKGAIGLFSGSKIARKHLTTDAILMSLVSLSNHGS